jgi:hypothetical protein
VRDHRAHPLQPPRRLAQRPCGQQETVAQAACVDDRDLEVAAQPVMLQAVVEDEHVDIGVRLAQRRDHAQAIGPDPHRAAAAPRKQHRLVAHLGGIRSDGSGARGA